MPRPSDDYFARSFFPPGYFQSLSGAGGAVPSGSAPPVYGDGAAFDSIVAALRGTGAFAEVSLGVTPDQRVASAGATPAALVLPQSWEEFDDSDPALPVRQVQFSLTLVVRDEDPQACYASAVALTAIAQDVLNGSDLGGGCLAALTALNRGRYDPGSRPPELRVILEGEFSYLIPSPNGHAGGSTATF